MNDSKEPNELDVQTLWEKYEETAMHFNDLLIQLRMRSLAGTAAAATLVGIFADGVAEDAYYGWLIAAAFFVAMLFVWAAIFCLDYFYYNKLLWGAVNAITELEENTANGNPTTKINLSTSIKGQFAVGKKGDSNFGVNAFYIIVAMLLVLGVGASSRMAWITREEPHSMERSRQVEPTPNSPTLSMTSLLSLS